MLPLPSMVRSFPDVVFSFLTSSPMFPVRILVLFHSAFFNVLEKTIFSASFMPLATSGMLLSAAGVGHQLTIMW